jgi:hypothetical protein
VPEAEVTQRRCCCNPSTDPEPGPCAEGCPTPLSPATQNRWRVVAEAYAIYPSQTSGNMLTVGDLAISGSWVPDQPLDCMATSGCEIVPYTRKKVFMQDWYAGDGVCNDIDKIIEACDGMDQGPADPFFGSDAVEWDGCTGFNIDDDGTWSSSVHLQDTNGDGVQMRSYQVDQKWVAGTSGTDRFFAPVTGTEEHPDCMSVVTVRYFYYNSFNCALYRNVDNYCMSSQVSVSVASHWVCQYAKRQDSTSKIPTGRYKLMSVQWSGPFETYKPRSDGHCCDVCDSTAADTYTRASYDDTGPIILPGTSTWQPPQYVEVNRLA